MNFAEVKPNSKGFWLFSAGISIVLLSFWFSFIPDWLTFIHIWRVELFASVFFAVTLGIILSRSKPNDFLATFSKEERHFIIYPLLAFVFWSLVSAFWSESWGSAFHHALVWSEYLVFYFLIRIVLDSEEKQERFLFVLAGVLALYALPAVAAYISVQIFDGSSMLGIRFSRFGEQVIVLLPILIAVTVTLRGNFRWIRYTLIASAWLLVICSMSRATIFLGIVVSATAIIALILSGRFKGNKLAIAMTLAVLVSAPVLLNAPGLLSREENTPVVGRFSDSTSLSDSNGFRKLMIALSLEMIADKPLTGIGADNFGFQVHRYRETFAAKNPESPLLSFAESEIPERAHNEYLQIAAELGVVGIAIFAWFLVGISMITWRSIARIRHIPVVAVAATIGILGFLAAGLVTSYSFRLIQNGFFFFFALSIAAKYFMAETETKMRSETAPYLSMRWACVAGICSCLLLALYSVTRVASVIMQERASVTKDREMAAKLHRYASWMDHENPVALKSSGMRAFRDLDFAKAVPLLQLSVEMGDSTSTSYSYLASAQILSGDTVAAENTLRKAAEIYPHSVFVQSRFSSILKTNGKDDQAAHVFDRARAINSKAAATWLTLLTKGAAEVSSQAVNPNSGIIQVMSLTPQSGLYSVMSERLIKHPEEQKFSMFKAHN